MDEMTFKLAGYVAATLTTAAFVPQIVKTWRTKSAGDLSMVSLLSFTVGLALWIVHGAATQSIPIVAANATTLGLNLTLIVPKLRERRSRRRRPLSFPAQHHRRDPKRVDRLHRLQREAGLAKEVRQIEMPIDARDAGRQASDGVGHSLAPLAGLNPVEMVEEHQPALRAADAQHLARDGNGVGHDVDQVRRVDGVEARIGKSQTARIHPAQCDVTGAVTSQTVLGPFDHRRREVDRHDVAAARILGQAHAGADANFENGLSSGGSQARHRPAAPRLQCRAVNHVVEGRETSIDLFSRGHSDQSGVGIGPPVTVAGRRNNRLSSTQNLRQIHRRPGL